MWEGVSRAGSKHWRTDLLSKSQVIALGRRWRFDSDKRECGAGLQPWGYLMKGPGGVITKEPWRDSQRRRRKTGAPATKTVIFQGVACC